MDTFSIGYGTIVLFITYLFIFFGSLVCLINSHIQNTNMSIIDHSLHHTEQVIRKESFVSYEEGCFYLGTLCLDLKLYPSLWIDNIIGLPWTKTIFPDK